MIGQGWLCPELEAATPGSRRSVNYGGIGMQDKCVKNLVRTELGRGLNADRPSTISRCTHAALEQRFNACTRYKTPKIVRDPPFSPFLPTTTTHPCPAIVVVVVAVVVAVVRCATAVAQIRVCVCPYPPLNK